MTLISLINAIKFPDWISDTAIPITDSYGIKWYGISYIVGISLAYIYSRRAIARKELWVPEGVTRGADGVPNKTTLEDFTFYVILGIFVGGRVGSILLYNTSWYLENPIEIFKIWKGGMAFHGGFAGVCLAVWYFSRKHKISLMRWADLAAIGAPLGIFCVRLANFVNQELYGRAADVPWAFIFETDAGSTPRHPSQLYEAFLEGILLFLIIRFATHRKKALSRPGIAAGLFFLFYGIFRFTVEFFREPDRIPQISEYFTRGMAYSTPMILIGLWMVWWASRRPPVAPRHEKETLKNSAKDKETA